MRRGWMDHPVFHVTDEPFDRRSAYAYLVEGANYGPGEKPFNGFTVKLERGEIAASLRYLARAWNWHASRVQRFINRLKADALIDTRVDTSSDAGVMVITICNYNDLQTARGEADAPADTVADAGVKLARYETEEYITDNVDETRRVGGAGGTVASDRPAPEPEPEPAPGGKGKGWSPKINHPDQLDLINDTALAAEPAPVAPVQAVPIETGPPDLGVPALGGNVVPIGKGRKPREASARRWGADEAVPIDWIAEAAAIRRNKGLPEIDLDTEAEMFADYWRGASGSGARKHDWRAAWRNWVRRSDKFGGRGHGQGNSSNGVRYSRNGEGSSQEVNRRAIFDAVFNR